MELLGEHAGRGDYIPVAGNIIGILPPTLYAVLQFREWTMPGIVFAGYAVLQIAISNFLYPWLQGRGLALSPLVARQVGLVEQLLPFRAWRRMCAGL